MKNLFKLLLLAMVAMAGAACDKEENKHLIWDYANYTIAFAVEDAETGEDLLDPATEGNILGQEIKVVYNEKEYPRWTKDGLEAWDIEDIASTRFNKPQTLALRWGWSNDAYSYLVTFGEFSPAEDFRQESFIIDWGDGTQNEIVFDCYDTWKNGKPTIHTDCWMDGVKQKGKIVLKK